MADTCEVPNIWRERVFCRYQSGYPFEDVFPDIARAVPSRSAAKKGGNVLRQCDKQCGYSSRTFVCFNALLYPIREGHTNDTSAFTKCHLPNKS